MTEAPTARTYVVRFSSGAAGNLHGRVTDVASHRSGALVDPQRVREHLLGSDFARAVVVRFEGDGAGNVTARAIDPLTRRATPVREAPELLAIFTRCAAS